MWSADRSMDPSGRISRRQLAILIGANLPGTFRKLAYFLLIASVCANGDERKPLVTNGQRSMDDFSAQLHETFERHTRLALVKQGIEAQMDGKLAIAPERTSGTLDEIHSDVRKFLHKKISALQRIVEASEQAAASTIDEGEEFEMDDTKCNDFTEKLDNFDMKLMNRRDSNFKSNSNKSISGVHIIVEAYRCEYGIWRDYSWTGSDIIQQAFEHNLKDDKQIVLQFIGTSSGLTRMFPARRWVIEPESITIDLFDPRFRPWYTAAQSSPKDVLFLIDMSGSVRGQTAHLIRMTVLYVLATLNANDYVNAVWFNSRQVTVLSACFDNFAPATTHNKRVLRELLNQVDEKDQANINNALNSSISMFLMGQTNITDIWNETWTASSGGHKIIMLLTDGSDGGGSLVVLSRTDQLRADPVRIFGFSMGYGIARLKSLDLIACHTNALNAVVGTVADVKRESVSYLGILSESLAHTLQELPVHQRPVIWTTPYMDSQASGATITLSQPILGPIRNSSVRHPVGVAAVDIGYQQIVNLLPNTEQHYAFIADNNGMLIYHPKLKIPKAEVYSVRRTACNDKRSGARGGGRLQFSESDESVLKLMGLFDSIPTTDMVELESDTIAFHELRKAMIDQQCEGFTSQDEYKRYQCQAIDGTPFSIGFVVFRNRNEIVFKFNVPRPSSSLHSLLGHYIPERRICHGRLDHLDESARFDAFLNTKCTEDKRLAYALINSLDQWKNSWSSAADNFTCADYSLSAMESGGSTDRNYHINSFVNTISHITVFYPQCNLQALKPALDMLDGFKSQHWWSSSSGRLGMTVLNDEKSHQSIIAYRPVFDSDFRPLAVVGVQWSSTFINDLLLNDTQHTWPICQQTMDKNCHILSSNGYIVGGDLVNQHLSATDPFLFDQLLRKSLIKKTTRQDSQSECKPSMYYLFAHSSATDMTKSNIFSIFILRFMDFLTTAFWLDLWILFNKLVRNVRSNPITTIVENCPYAKVSKIEVCTIEYTTYQIDISEKRRMVLNDGICSRDVTLIPFPDVTIYLLITNKPCAQPKASALHEHLPRRIPICEQIKPRYRRRRLDLIYTRRHPKDDELSCMCTRIIQNLWLIISTALIWISSEV